MILRQCSYYLLLFIFLGSPWGVAFLCPMASAGDDTLVMRGIKNIAARKAVACESFLTSPRIAVVAETLGFQILQNSVKNFRLPEDRTLVALAQSPDSPQLAGLTSTGREDMTRLLQAKLTSARIASALTGASPLTEQQGQEILQSQSDLQLKKFIDIKNLRRWNEAIGIYENEFNDDTRRLELARQQYAFCLNRRKAPGDAERAEQILRQLIDEGSVNGETYGLLGRIYKDRFGRAREDDAPPDVQLALLDEAIRIYDLGFIMDPTDYFPAINVIQLLAERADKPSIARARELAITVRHLAQRLVKLGEADLWVHATLFALAVLEGQWQIARTEMQHFEMSAPAGWQYETLLNGIQWYRKIYASDSAETDRAEYLAFQSTLEKRIRNQRSNPVRIESVDASNQRQLNGDGVLNTKSIDINQEADATGMGVHLDIFRRYSRGVMDPQTFLRQFAHGQNDGYILGMTSDNHRFTYQSYAKAAHLETWWDSYRRLGISSENSQHTNLFMDQITTENRPIVFLVPRGLFHSTSEISFTAKEMDWLLSDPKTRTRNVTFVFGAYDLIPEGFVKEMRSRHGDAPSYNLIDLIIQGYQQFLFRY